MSQNHRVNLGAQLFKVELAAFLDLCECVNTPRSVACYMLASSASWDQYLELSSPDTDLPTFADDYLVTECMRKNPSLPTSCKPREVAVETWYRSEQACAQTNQLLEEYSRGGISFHPNVELLITKTQKIISEVLGPLGPRELAYAEANFRFGPGATSHCSGKDVVLSRKMTSVMGVTPSLKPYFRVLKTATWRHSTLNTVEELPGNKVTFVPKNAKTDRAIAIEPHMNIYVQLGVGKLLRRRLREAGLNLDSSSEINRFRASRAHLDGLATIDLSSASDTIAYMLVMLLLPPDWFALLDVCRSAKSRINDTWVDLEKFSSMGNGYTFELETLIFWALARACGDLDPVVFGDDIIVDRVVASELIPLLNLLGFSINKQKTYLAGRFFESCGADYWCGQNVRPCYFKGGYADVTSAVIRVANKIRLYAHRRGANLYCDGRFFRAWNQISSSDPRARRTAIPYGAGDNGLIKNFDESTPAKARHGYSGFFGTVWRANARRSKRTVELGAYLSALAWGTPGDRSRCLEDERNSMERSKIARQYVLYWSDLGPWLV